MGTSPKPGDIANREAAQRIIGEFTPESSRLAKTPDSNHLEALAEDLGVKNVLTRPLSDAQHLHSGVDAMLVPVPGGYSVVINEAAPYTRRRYSLAHELGHVMVQMAQLSPPSPLTRYRSSSHAMEITRAEERLCDAIAAELLMPEKLFKAAVEASGRSLKHMSRMASHFGASLTATVIRYWELLPEPCHLIRWRSPADRRGVIVPAWQMRNVVHGLRLSPVRDSSRATRDEFQIVRETWSTLTNARSLERLLVEHAFAGQRYVRAVTFETESIGFGSRSNRSALSAVYLDRTDNPT